MNPAEHRHPSRPTARGDQDPRQDPRLRVVPFGERGSNGCDYYIYADVLAELAKAARFRDQAAVALLTGSLQMGGDGIFVEITGFGELQYLYGEDLLEVTAAALVQGEDPQGEVVGAFVSPHGTDGLLTEELVRLHLSLFNLPHQVLLVVDPTSEIFGLYGRESSGRMENFGFSLIRTREIGGDDEFVKNSEMTAEEERE